MAGWVGGPWPGVTVVLTVVFAAAVAAHLPEGSGWAVARDAGLYPAVTAAGSVTAGLRAMRRGPAWPWAALALGLGLNTVANVYYSLALANLPDAPYPSWADAGYLALFPCVYVCLLGLLRARLARWHASLALDGLIAALICVAGCAGFVLRPVLQITDGRVAVVVTNLAYPVGDLLLLAVLVAGLVMLAGRVDRELGLLLAGLLWFTAGDCIYAVVDSAGGYREGGILDLTWLVGASLMALAAAPARPGPTEAGPTAAGPTAAGLTGPGPTAIGPASTTTAAKSRTTTARAAAAGVGAGGPRAQWGLLGLPLVGSAGAITLLSPPIEDALSPLARWLALATLVAATGRMALTFREVWALKDARRLASTDELTGLLNRRGFTDTATGLLHQHRAGPSRSPTAAGSTAGSTALLLLDLDGFKEVNDSLGHAAGDTLLVTFAGRLSAALRSPADVLARLGGDEFALLLPDTDPARAVGLADRLRAVLAEPIVIDDVRVHVTGSFGIAVAPDHGSDLSLLLRRADIAMYRAKITRTGVQVYDPARSRSPLGQCDPRHRRIAVSGPPRSAYTRQRTHASHHPVGC
jgi:diguanylate cyclase (GGDEF)-like protein